MWKTGDAYEDIKFLAHQINENLFTALHNIDGIECNNADKSCDEKLVNVYFKSWVLLDNVGPKSFRNLSYICQKYVRKQSVTKISQKTVRYVSYIGHKTVRCKYMSEFCKKRLGNASEMYHILIMCHKTVSALFGKLFEICQKYQF